MHPRIRAVAHGELAQRASHFVAGEGSQRERGLVTDKQVRVVGQRNDGVANVGVVGKQLGDSKRVQNLFW